MPEIISAAEAALIDKMSWGFDWSAPMTVVTTWVSLRKPSANDGRSGRSSGQLVENVAKGLEGRRTPTRLSNGHHEKGEVDSGGARNHCMDQALVTGYVNKMKLHIRIGELGESEIDGNPAVFLLGQPVAIGARESFHKSRFAMIDMPCSSPDDVLHPLMVHGPMARDRGPI